MLNPTRSRMNLETHPSVLAPELVFHSKETRDAFDQGVTYGQASVFEHIDDNDLYHPDGIPT